MRLTSLDNIVRDICIVNLQNSSLSQYMRVARAVRSALMQVNLHFLPSVSSKLVEVGDNFTATLPHDAVVVTKVGVFCEDGTIVTLMSDPSLRSVQYEKAQELPLYCECEQPPESVVTPIDTTGLLAFYNVQWGNWRYGELYGRSNAATHAITWRHNKDFGVLEFSSTWIEPGFKVLVEYKTDGTGGYTIIPVEAQPAIKAYALYELFQLQPNKADFYMREFRRLADQMKRLHANTDWLAITNALLSGQRSSPK